MMRTTLDIPDDVYEMVRSLAAARGIAIEDAILELARKGLRSEACVRNQNIFPTFTVPDGAAIIMLEQTLSVEDGV